MRFQVLVIIIVIVVSIIAGFRLVLDNANKTMYLITSDKVKIAYDLYEVKNSKGWLILTHMMPAAKESWQEFAVAAQQLGYESVVIDLRGHGKSAGGPDGYKNFSDAEHQSSIQDLEAAWEFLKSRGAAPEKMTLIGASIGANLSLQFLSKNPAFKKAVLLSPGLNYRGIKTEPLAKSLQKDQSLVFAASKGDGNNAEENKKLYELAPSLNKHLIFFDGAGHGTELFDLKEEFDLTGAIVKFLNHGSIN